MNIFLSFIQLLTIILICVFEYKKKYISVFLWGTLLIMFGIPHFLSIITNNYIYNTEVMIKASLFVILFNSVYFISRLFMTLMTRKTLIIDISNKEPMENQVKTIEKDKRFLKYSYYALITCLIILIGYVINHLGSIINASWGRIHVLNREMGLKSIIRYTNFVLFACGGLILVFGQQSKRGKFLVSLGIVLMYTFITGNRIIVLPALVSLIILFTFSQKNKVTIKQILIFSILAAFTVYLVYYLRLLRIYGGFSNLITANFIEVNSQVLTMILNGEGELSLRNAFYHFIYHENNFENFSEGQTYIRLLLIAFPTSLTGGLKPPDFSYSMGSAWKGLPLNSGYSMHPTFYGDAFANFAWGGVVFAIIWAVITLIIERLVKRKNVSANQLMMVLFGTVYVIIGRGSVYNGFFIGYAGTIIIGLLYLLSRLRIKL